MSGSSIPEAVTHGIRIRVRSRFLPERSDPSASQWVWAYDVTIENDGDEPAKLLTRHWIITDADGVVEQVRGDGVVGEQPFLSPGEEFSYTSFCPLGTPWGSMKGSYGMARPDGTTFDAAIPEFPLGEPGPVN